MREIACFIIWYSQAGAEACRENPNGLGLFGKVAWQLADSQLRRSVEISGDQQAQTCFALGVKQPLCPKLNDVAPFRLLNAKAALESKLAAW